jgi:DsbC/DsbD-like thiol-disulfide interchange protein
VVFPVLVTPADPKAPVRLELALEYGVCKEICIPARAEIALDLTHDVLGEGLVRLALARVPTPQPLGAGGALAILAAEPLPASGDKPRIAVTVRSPEGPGPMLFAEGPDAWFVSTPPRARSWVRARAASSPPSRSGRRMQAPSPCASRSWQGRRRSRPT